MKIKFAFILMIAVLLTGFFIACELEKIPEVDITITFDSAGAEEYNSIVVTSGQTLGDRLPNPSRIGYEFLGWFDGVTEYKRDTVIGGKDMTLTARWKEIIIDTSNKIVVSFNSGGGIPSTETVSIEPGKSLGLNFPIDPRRKGFKFEGWESSGTAFEATTVVSVNTNVTAKWTAKTEFTVTFDIGSLGTSQTPSPIQVYDGDFAHDWGGIFPANPVPAVHDSAFAENKFNYWSINGTENEIFSTLTPVTRNITVTANYRIGLIKPMTAVLDLSEFQTTAGSAVTLPASQSYNPVTGVFTATITINGQAVAFRTPNGTIAPDQPNIREALRYADNVLYEIVGVATPDEDRLFRIIIGRTDAGNNWDGVSPTIDMKFSDFITSDEEGNPVGITATPGATIISNLNRQSVIIQARGSGHTTDSPTTITISKITVTIW